MAKRREAPVPTEPRVAGLWIYPVKSCRGVAVARAEVGPWGFAHDREWMVVDAGGRFLSQRTHPEMARVGVQLLSDAVELRAPGREPLRLPLAGPRGPTREVRIWNDRCRAVSEGPEAARWFAGVLDIPCHLVRLPADEVRPVDARYARPGERVGFADAFPFLLLSEGSLAELNRRLSHPVEVERFRPNLLVSGCEPHAEDRWRRIEIAGVRFRVAKPCSRCVIPNVDPATGRAGKEPLRTLAGYRKRDGKVLFGQNLIHEGRGTLSVGDAVRVSPV